MTSTITTTTLGQTGITVPSLCIGTWSWGDNFFWDYGKSFGEAEVEAAFNTALELGINFFDTAEVYGQGLSEELLGKFMQKTDRPVIMATKYSPLPWRIWGNSVADALTASLKRLQVPQVALYQVHWPFIFLMTQETLINALADEVKQGRILAVGVSNYSADEMELAHQILARRGIPLATNQVKYSLLNRKIEQKGILDRARQLGVTLLAYSPLAQGLLTGKYTPSNPPVGGRKMDSRFSQAGLEKIEPVMSVVRQIAAKYQRTPAQVALNWINAQTGVIAIAGAKNAAQVKDDAGALGWEMSQAELTQLQQVSRPWLLQ
ncbi:aldo/keto reductase [Limnoraphis robusta]|uniref:Aldo/keto reductase n=1 Tax=Limnoraphis robusta CCNP1315 TaxID=3110306 RepID=A0ABU5U240_9CYAN|nr:aldo/keto reductase [Limnoraphis robusta]MEA5521259.1 aldo/keto reductase [Limnoraphis robusta CCNP1315]MEA5543698.1 aldo/keto reductase [Limnoraphis robusta CCNP1324]